MTEEMKVIVKSDLDLDFYPRVGFWWGFKLACGIGCGILVSSLIGLTIFSLIGVSLQ